MTSRYKIGDEVTHVGSGKKVWKIASVSHNVPSIQTVYIIVPNGKNKAGFFTAARASDMRKAKK